MATSINMNACRANPEINCPYKRDPEFCAEVAKGMVTLAMRELSAAENPVFGLDPKDVRCAADLPRAGQVMEAK